MEWAVFFPGQGSQSVGMLADMAAHFPQVEQRFSQASALLGYDVWALCQTDNAKQLHQTTYTQPAMLTADVALWDVWCAQTDKRPDLMMGHSLGEYSALVCAGSMAFEAALPLVVQRAEAMQAAVPEGEGAMAAVLGLDDAAVQALCDDAAEDAVLSSANWNAVGQVVVAGEAQAVDRFIVAAKAAGAKKVVKLPVSVPSHCALMAKAQPPLQAALDACAMQLPHIPVWHNATLGPCQDVPGIKTALVEQLVAPVPWVALIQRAYQGGVQQALECGPGKVLTGLNKRIERALLTMPSHTPEAFDQALQRMGDKNG